MARKRYLRRWFALIAGSAALAVGCLYGFLYCLNALWPTAADVLVPQALYPAMFRIGLIGKVERAYYDSGRLRYEKQWLPDHVDILYGSTHVAYGQWTSVSPDGKTILTLDFPGATGKWVEWHPNGRKAIEAEYLAGRRHGTVRFRREDGSLLWEQDFRGGVEHGLWTIWSQNGVKLQQAHYRDGVPDGRWQYWYEDGTKRRETEYREGEPCGRWLSFSPQGALAADLLFPHATGKWIQWHENAVLAVEGEYLEGRQHGTWRYWRFDGSFSRETQYD